MRKILLCDDECDIREVLEMLIEVEYEAEFTHAIDGQDAIGLLRQYPGKFDLIICDMNMPNKNGLDVFNFNYDLGGKVPFFLVSAQADDISKFKDFYTINSKNTQIMQSLITI